MVRRRSPYRPGAPRTIAFTERALVLVLGGVLIFSGFLAGMWSDIAGWIRLLVGVVLVGLGVALAVLAVHTPASTARRRDNRQLMVVERLLLAPLALLYGAAMVLVVIDRDLGMGVRILVLMLLTLPTMLFAVTVFATDRVPGRDPTSVEPAPPPRRPR